MDTSGNNAVPVSRTVMVKDTTPPVITLNCPAIFLSCPTTVQVIQDGPYHEYGAVCSDMVDGEWISIQTVIQLSPVRQDPTS